MVLGARVPIILTSRADSVRSRMWPRVRQRSFSRMRGIARQHYRHDLPGYDRAAHGPEPRLAPVVVCGSTTLPQQRPGKSFDRRPVLRLVTTHLARRQTPSLTEPVHPADRRADADLKLLGRLVARQSAALNRDNSLPKLQRVWPPLPCWPPPARMVNQRRADLDSQIDSSQAQFREVVFGRGRLALGVVDLIGVYALSQSNQFPGESPCAIRPEMPASMSCKPSATWVTPRITPKSISSGPS